MSGHASCPVCEAHGPLFLIEGTTIEGTAIRLCAGCVSHGVLVKAWTEGFERRSGRAVDLPDRVLP
jgi:hypothetical protein